MLKKLGRKCVKGGRREITEINIIRHNESENRVRIKGKRKKKTRRSGEF